MKYIHQNVYQTYKNKFKIFVSKAFHEYAYIVKIF